MELERIQKTKVKLTSILTGLPSSNVSKRPDDRWNEVMDYTTELVDYITDRVHELLQELEVLEQAIDALPARQRTILTARYIVGMPFKDIIKKFPLSERTVYNIHQQALERIDMTELDKITLKYYQNK